MPSEPTRTSHVADVPSLKLSVIGSVEEGELETVGSVYDTRRLEKCNIEDLLRR